MNLLRRFLGAEPKALCIECKSPTPLDDIRNTVIGRLCPTCLRIYRSKMNPGNAEGEGYIGGGCMVDKNGNTRDALFTELDELDQSY